jgi:hypothetical protein
MAFKFNPFTGTLDVVNAPPDQYIDGEVEFHGDLPVSLGVPAINSAFLVRKGSGVYFISRKPAGIWVRELNNGNLDDWKYAGTFSDLYRDANFRIINDADASKEIAFSAASITSGQTRTLAAPDRDGRVSVSDYRLLSANANAVTGDKVAADTTSGAWTLTLPATPANGDTVTVLDYAGTFDTDNLTIARNGSNIESLAEDLVCEVEDAAFTLVFVGSTVGWKVVPFYGSIVGELVRYIIACSDETTNLTTGTAKVTFRAPYVFTLTGVRASVNTAPTGSTLIVDINNGANSTLSTKLSIDASEKTSVTAVAPAVIDPTYAIISDDAEITIDIDQIGSTIAGTGLKVTLIGTRA